MFKLNKEKWIWVHGYKGVSKDMTGYGGFQYELGKQYDIPDGEEIRKCVNGFHFCQDLRDVFRYVEIKNNNRFFRVRALVRAEDLVSDLELTSAKDRYFVNPALFGDADKMVAKSIILTEELDSDTIFESIKNTSISFSCDYQSWSDEDKKLVRSIGIKDATTYFRCRKLQEAGYSFAFSEYIASDREQFERAIVLSTMPELSAEVKALLILGGK